MRFATGTAPPHCQSGAEKKESTGHHLSPACRPCATPSSLSFFGHQIRDARTAEDKSAKSNGVNESAKVVLAAGGLSVHFLQKLAHCIELSGEAFPISGLQSLHRLIVAIERLP